MQGANSPLEGGQGGVDPTRAFVEAMGQLGNYYHDQYEHGNRDVIQALSAEEANLLHARHLARNFGWWHCIIAIMQGLRSLYDHTGRRSEWARLVEEIVSDFVDPATDGPLPGREESWSLVTGYRVRLARQAREWTKAERLQRILVDWDRQQAANALAAAPEALNSTQRNQIRTLAASLHELGEIQLEIGQKECVKAYEESLKLLEQIGDQAATATCAYNLGHVYMLLPDLHDLEQAEAWYQRSLELRAEGDRLGQATCLRELGTVVTERFKEARAADQSEEELLRHINDALNYYQQALKLFPPNAVNQLAVTHNQLGNIYDDAGDLGRALFHYREAIRYTEAEQNFYQAGQIRFNVAATLKDAERLEDALLYAQAALRNYQTYGDRAADKIQKTQELIAKIEEDMRKT